MLAYRYPIIAREGWSWIAIAAVAALVVQIFYAWLALPLWLLTLILLYLFRDPARKVPASPLGVVSPVDGKVISVETVHDAYLDRQAICVSIEMGFTSVYSIHSPMEGKIMQTWRKVPRKIDIASRNPEREPDTHAQWIQSDESDDIVLVMESRPLSAEPLCYAHSGERVGQGQRCGYIRFGSRIEVLLPESSRVEVQAGAKILAGADIIANLRRVEANPPQAEAASF